MATTTAQRRNDLDWIRVLAILMVFLTHSAFAFSTLDWHIKNPTPNLAADVWGLFIAGWLMPLIFLISGSGIYFALGKGGARRFVRERVVRLLVPLAFGVCTHIALQEYLEYVSKGTFSGSFWDFIPVYFTGFRDMGGNFGWTGFHLWYLWALFIFSVLFLPLFLWLRRGAGNRLLNQAGSLLARPGALLLVVLPVVLTAHFIESDLGLSSRGWVAWGSPSYVPLFLAGFLIVSHDGLQAAIRVNRWFWLAVGAGMFAVILWLGAVEGDLRFMGVNFDSFFVIYSLFSWPFCLAILGFGMEHLTLRSPVLQYANEAVMPFYILHQTVIVCVAYLVVQMAIPDLLKFAVITVTSFVVIIGLYELLVRRINLLRFLFGMRTRTKPLVPKPHSDLVPSQ